MGSLRIERRFLVAVASAAVLLACREDKPAQPGQGLRTISPSPQVTAHGLGLVQQVSPPIQLLKDPTPVDAVVRQLHFDGVSEAIVILLRVNKNGRVEDCLVESPKLSKDQSEQICAAARLREYAPGRAGEIRVVSTVHLR